MQTVFTHLISGLTELINELKICRGGSLKAQWLVCIITKGSTPGGK